jgi:hypothetical protein
MIDDQQLKGNLQTSSPISDVREHEAAVAISETRSSLLVRTRAALPFGHRKYISSKSASPSPCPFPGPGPGPGPGPLTGPSPSPCPFPGPSPSQR